MVDVPPPMTEIREMPPPTRSDPNRKELTMAQEATARELTLAEEQAFQLSRCAIEIDQARENRDQDFSQMVSALNENLEVWVAIRTMAMQKDSGFSEEIKENLTKLSKFVAEKTFDSAEGLSDQTIDTLINVNLQISEGLLEGAGA